MILFVLEGERPDLRLYRSMMEACGVAGETVAAVYGCNIDALYYEMKALGEGADIVDLLRLKYQNDKSNPFKKITRSDQFSEIYLIFDYDFHDVNRTPEEMNDQLSFLLSFFDEETEHGKLYINYPMIESIKYTKELPDPNYSQYCVSREECRSFKQLAASFSYYPNMAFIQSGDLDKRVRNWELLKIQNVAKANYICNRINSFPPAEKDSISQRQILQHQICDYESQPGCLVSVLSSFPILMFDWLGR